MFCDGQREGYKPKCILKTRLNEETDTVKKLTEGRDSFKTAIQIVTKDLMNLSDNRLISNSNQLSDENRSRLKNVSGSQRKKKPKPWDPPQHVNHQNRFEPLRQEDSVKDSTPSNADKSFTAVLLDDSMINQMQGWRLGRKVGHHVLLNLSLVQPPEIWNYLMPTIDKSPQQIIPHVGTNYLVCDHTPTVVAENIVDLARKIEMKSNAEVVSLELCQDHTMFQTMLWKLLTKASWNTVIKMTGEWLSIKTSTEIV